MYAGVEEMLSRGVCEDQVLGGRRYTLPYIL